MARNKRTGEGISIPLHFELKTDEALKDLEKFANQVKADVSGFSAAKRILDGFEKSLNGAFDGKNVDKFSSKLLKMQETASKSAKDLIGMRDQFKEVFERQQIRDEWSSPEKQNEFVTTYQAALDKLKAINEEYTKIANSGAREGIGNLDYYKRMVEGANEARARMQSLIEKRNELEASGGKGTDEWKRIVEAITSARRSMNGYEVQKKRAMDPSAEAAAKARWAELEKEEERAKEVIRQYAIIQEAIQSEATDMPIIEKFQKLVTIVKAADLNIQNLLRDSNESPGSNSNLGMARGFYLMRTIIRDISKGIDKLRAKIHDFTSGIANAAKKMLHLNKESGKTTHTLRDGFKHALSMVLRYGLGIRSLFFLFRRLRKYAKEALDEMAKTFPEVNTQMSRAVTALNQMKGALGTAIQPLLTVVVPVLEKIANLISRIMSLIGGVFATLTGQGKIYTAVATQTDYAASLEKTGSAAKKAKKELEGYLSPIDEINKYQSKRDDADDSGSGGGAGGPGFKYVETPISDFAKKIADIINKLLAPIKKAWEDMGDIVVASWKRAWNSIKKLLTDIGKDFLTMWNQEATVEMFRDIFRILADIGDIVYFLTKNFDEAWNKNKVGLHILEKIRDIFAIIIDHVEKMTSATVEWAKNLDFSPLLEAMDKWLESLKPVVDNIAGVFEDFYIKVLLPLSKWAIEKGLPELLGIFEDFNNKVDWEGLRSKLSELWTHLEPFAERVGEGLLLFIDDISEKLANLLNSEVFDTLITKMGEFMDSVTAEDVEGALWGIVNALIALKGLAAVASVLSNVALAIKEISIIVKNWAAISKILSVIGTALSYIGAFVAGIAGAALAVYEFVKQWQEGWDAISTILEALGIAIAAIAAIVLGAPIAIAAAVAAIVFAISQIAIAIHDNWDSIVAWYEANIQPAIDEVEKTISDLIDKLVGWWNTNIKPMIDSIGETVTSVWKQYISPISGYVKEMVNNLSTLIKTVWENQVKPTLQAIWTLIQYLWNGHIKPMLSIVVTTIQGVWNGKIKPILSFLKTGVKETVEFITNVIKILIKYIGSTINTIMQMLNGIIKFITGVFTGDWKKAWEGVKDVFKGIINNLITIFETGLNLIISALNAIQIPVPWEWAKKVVGTDNIGFNIEQISLPRLAQGAVIPPNREFMAVLGDQKSGTNIETPLSTMVEAFNQALRSSDVGGVKQINFLLPDRRTLAQYTIAGGRIIQTSTGKNPFELA